MQKWLSLWKLPFDTVNNSMLPVLCNSCYCAQAPVIALVLNVVMKYSNMSLRKLLSQRASSVTEPLTYNDTQMMILC